MAGRYRILASSGRGGMGVVYRADDLVLGETVALKFLPDDVARDPQRLARLRNEVRLARQVSHPNICRVYDVAESDGRHFLTMEHLAGEDLEARLRARGRPPSDEALAIARQLCAGLAAAHERGVLHRDLKPANILLDERGVARIADFGLAEAGARVAGPRAREGTPEYMAPEALAGGEVTARSDIYALGLVLRDLFIGRQRPAAGAPGEAMAGSGMPPSGAGPAVPVPDPAVERLIARCLEPEPERRPASARAVLAALPGGAPFAAALAAAQQRADRIAAFRAELAELLRAGALALDAPRLAALRRYHEGVLADLVRDFDVDVDERGRHLSIGMMVVALVGALAVGASLLFLGYRVWGFMAFPMQAGILAVLPAAGLAATAIVGARDRTGYFTAIAAAFAFAGLVIDTTVLSGTLGLAGSPMALLAWAVFALILAFGYGTRLLLFTGVVCLAFFTATAIPHFMGAYWGEGMERWEGMIPAGVLALAASGPLGRRFRPEFAPLLRVLGLALVFAPALLLANDMQPSSLPFPGGAVAVGYQVAALLIGTGAVGAGIAGRARDLVYMGGACLVVLLYSKMVHWFWEWMPRYVFFLIVAAAAIGVLLLLRRLRGVLSAPPAEARP